MAGEQCSICLEALDGGEVALAWCRDRSAVVAPDMARDPTAPTSKFWGVSWKTNKGRWLARYTDANGKSRTIGYFDTQEEAAHAANAAIRRAGLEGKRHTNPVVDGRLVPRVLKARTTRGARRRAVDAPAQLSKKARLLE